MLTTYLARLRGMHRNARLFLISNSIVNISVAAIGVLYTLFLTRLGFGTDFLSALLVLGIAGAGLGLLPAIAIANRYSARKLLIWSNILGGIAAGVQLIFPQAAILLVTSFFIGASASIYIVLTPPLLAASSNSADRTHLFSLNATLGLLTGVVGTLLGGFLPDIMGLPAVLHFPLISHWQPWLTHGGALPLQLGVLAAALLALPMLWPLWLMDDTVVGEQTNHAKQITQQRFTVRDLPVLFRRVRGWRATRFVAYQGLLGLGAGMFLTYINLYFVDHLRINTASYGAIASAMTILLAVATLGAPLLAERFGAARGPVVAQFLSVPMLLGLAFITNIPFVVALYLLRGTLMNLGQPALQSFVMGILPPGERGAASSAFNVAFQVMAGLGGVLSGIVIAHAGYWLLFLSAAVCYFAGMLLLTPWFGREKALLHAENLTEAQYMESI